MNEDNFAVTESQGVSRIDTEALSELLELESRRYSRRLTEEDEARLR